MLPTHLHMSVGKNKGKNRSVLRTFDFLLRIVFAFAAIAFDIHTKGVQSWVAQVRGGKGDVSLNIAH